MPDTHNRNQRWVADVVTEDVLTRDQLLPEDAPAGFWGTAWRNLRRRPMFWVSTVIILAVLLVTVFPGLFTSTDPTAATLEDSSSPPATATPSASPSRATTSSPAPSTVPRHPWSPAW